MAFGSSATNGIAVSGQLPNGFIATLSGRMDSLQELNLKNNRIIAGPSLPWVYTSFALKKVNISENNFGVVSGLTIFSDILGGAFNLQELYADRYPSSPAILAGQNLPNLPTILSNLQVLDMRNNGLRGNASLLFSSLPNLKKIYLTNNRLEQLSLTAHANLETVVIGDNELDSAIYLQNILANFSSLQMLEAEDALNTGILQSHPMFTITVGSTFNNIYVNIGGNKLTGAINLGSSGFSRIGTFIARNNNLTTVSFPTSFNTSLSFLNLEQNDFNQVLSCKK